MGGKKASAWWESIFLLLLGPFWCAQDDIAIALSACMTKPELISVSSLVAVTGTTAISRTIDEPSNMKNHKVFLFSGTNDTIVVPGM